MENLTRRNFFKMAGTVAVGLAASQFTGFKSALAQAPVIGSTDFTHTADINGSCAKVYFTKHIDAQHLIKLYDLINEGIYGKVAIKLHTGEQHGPNILPRDMVQAFQAHVPNSNIVETNTLYVGDRDTLTIGFAATKANAIDNAWKPYGDNGGKGDMREGSWWATDFVLRHLPVYHYKTDGSGWFTLCLPYDAAPSRGVRFYQIAGITRDKSQICLEEIAGTPAGVPCVVYSDHADVVIYETGEKVARRTPGPNGLNGLFITSATTPEN